MTPINIIAVAFLLLSVVASIACACRLRNWMHPVMLFAVVASGLLPFSARSAERPQPTPHMAADPVGQLVQTYYARLLKERHEQNQTD